MPRDQLTIPAVLMRGGTSKALFFHEKDLPAPGPARDRLLTRLIGSPDVLQIDGMGGARPITSKVAFVAPSARPDADVDYTYAQVGVESATVSYTGNCGNISSGVGPFAIDEHLVETTEPITQVRIYNVNTDSILVASVPVEDGIAKTAGDFAIAGVPGTGAEIRMDWRATVGALTGNLLPTGNVLDTITLEDGSSIRLTVCDAGNPVIWVDSTGLGDRYTSAMMDRTVSVEFAELIREVRGRVAVLLGVLDEWQQMDTNGLPRLLGFVSESSPYVTLSGGEIAADGMDVRVHVIFMDRLHESVPGSGSISLAAASRIPGSVVQEVTANPTTDVVRIGHPSGVTAARVRSRVTDTVPYVDFDDLGFSRTARRLMAGLAYFPAAVLDTQGAADAG